MGLEFNPTGMTASLTSRLNHLLQEHSCRYPCLQVQDCYKLLYQAAMGCGHSFSKPEQARVWLEAETSSLTPDAQQPLVEEISPDRRFVRVYLRPYRTFTENLEPLLKAFVRTATEFPGSKKLLDQYASIASQATEINGLSFSKADLVDFMDEMRSRAFPASHHTDIYLQQYQPAYRVIARQFLVDILSACQV
jgi:hypothetical protein